MPDAIEAMRRAFASFSNGTAIVPPRTHLNVERHNGISLIMPSLLPDEDAANEALAVKVVSVYEGNSRLGLARIQAAVLVVDPSTGVVLAVLEGAALTAIRTAAASGLATDLLARRDSKRLAILGAGVQARTHITAVCSVRPIEEICIYSRREESVDRLIDEFSRSKLEGVLFKRAPSAEKATQSADIVCCTTTSATPIFADADLAPGTHVNTIGAFTPDKREVPSATVARARVFVDSKSAAWEEAGDLIQPLHESAISRDHIIAELGELLLGREIGRRDQQEITLFKSVGLAIQDAAAAKVALENARRLGLGTQVNL